MELLVILLAILSALGAYQFFIWLYKVGYKPSILIGILPHYEIVKEGGKITDFGQHCIANEFIFDDSKFANIYDVAHPSILDSVNSHSLTSRKIERDVHGKCRLPILIQNLGKGFSKELFYVISFYENQIDGGKKSYGKIKVDNLLMERLDKCYLYNSDQRNSSTANYMVVADKIICKYYNEVDLLADYIYFESFLEPKAFVLNAIDIEVDKELNEFVVLFNIFSLQNEKIMITKYQHCQIIDQKQKLTKRST